MNEVVEFFVTVFLMFALFAATNAGLFFITRKYIREMHDGNAPWSWWVLLGYSTYVWKVFGVDIYRS